MSHQPVAAVLFLLLALVATPTWAWELSGRKTVTVHTRDQQRLTIGQVDFVPAAGGASSYTLTLDHAPFTDHFLSMKEFKCLSGGGEVSCHVPYPYAHPRTVTPANLAWLEHELLFLFKLPNEFGAKLWNGLYFQLRLTEQGLVGTPQAIDLNQISSPPAKLDVPPYRKALRDDISPGSRWITSITIE
ncbi:MAG: hypothetical protein RL375_394 [Pseudomonadota bacterium]